MKRCSVSLVVMEIPVRTVMRYNFTFTSMAVIQTMAAGKINR
jgi:hypothetical protein